MKRLAIIITSVILFVSSGCNRQSMERVSASAEDYVFEVQAAAAATGNTGTRSSYISGAEGDISDFMIFVFDKNGKSVSSHYYQGGTNLSGRELFINESLKTTFNDLFDVYIIANVGDLRSSASISTAGTPAISKIKSYTHTFSNDFSEFDEKGFPMAGQYEKYCPATASRIFYADKLVSQYNIQFTQSSKNHNTYTITGGRLCNVANKCTPFLLYKASSASDVSDSGDSFTSSDISALNAGNTASMFVLENEQGVVFPSSVNTEKLRKIESFPSSSIYRQTCTYAEFDVTVQTPTAVYDNVVYRYYFGDSLRDCSVHRNMIYNITINFDNVYVEDEGWRIEPGDPVIDEDAIVLSKPQLSIIKGMSNSFSLTRKAGVEYEMTYSQLDAQAYGLTINKSTSGNVDTYTISTSYTPPSGVRSTLQKVDYADIPVTFTTNDGFVSKVFTVRINKNPLLVNFSFPDGLGVIKVSNTVDWPDGTSLDTWVSGILYGENQYCSNRLLARYCCDIWQSFLDVYTGTSDLSGGDAATADYQSVDLNTAGIQTAMHELNSSHPIEHHYALGETENHYTTVGHAYFKIKYGIVIDGALASIPVQIIEDFSSSGNTFKTDYSGINTYVSNRAQKVPAWYYDPDIVNNNAADNYSGGYMRTGLTYDVSLQAPALGYSKGGLYDLRIEGASIDILGMSHNTYTPPIGIDITYEQP